MTKKDRTRNNLQVVAATAGHDTWKTWAGRTHGGDDFEFLDYFRGAKRAFCKRYLWSPPRSGTPCPICLEEPPSPDQWHVASSCGHAVCIDCLRGYAASQVRDPDHSGPLRCPSCPQPLRESDAVLALAGDADLVGIWDSKLRDQLLRALPSFRHCPLCEGKGGGDDSSTTRSERGGGGALAGGGFVTPECLTPINEERERSAEFLLDLIPLSNRLLMGAYFAYFHFYAQIHSSSFFVDLLNVLAPLAIIRRLWLLCNMAIARSARRAFFKPIVVECPCCNKPFVLNAESELAPGKGQIPDEATEKWIGNNCRPCPSCSAPISKTGGCNHMQCAKCRAHFCWACMRLRTNCASFRCSNGAPFGNANGGSTAMVEEIDGMGIIDRITQTENMATRLDRRDLAFIVGLIATIAGRETRLVQVTAQVAVVSAACILSGHVIMFCILAYLLAYMLQNFRNQLSGNGHNVLRQRNAQASGSSRVLTDERTEDELVAEAIARSLQEQ